MLGGGKKSVIQRPSIQVCCQFVDQTPVKRARMEARRVLGKLGLGSHTELHPAMEGALERRCEERQSQLAHRERVAEVSLALVSLAGGPARHWLGAALTLARTLEFVHDRGVVHGDVKARNVLFDAADRMRLADFAAALPRNASGKLLKRELRKTYWKEQARGNA